MKYRAFINIERKGVIDFEAADNQEAKAIGNELLNKILQKHGYILKFAKTCNGTKLQNVGASSGRQDVSVYADHGSRMDLVR